MTTSKLTLEYDGRRFHGWADQPGKRTVCSILTGALRILLREDVTLVCAGRTDAGVHARGQVVSYDGPLPERLRSLNSILPDDIGVISAEPAPDGFNARFDAKARRYEYRLHTRRAGPSPFTIGREVWWPHRADLGALQACAAALEGTHDFTAFTPATSQHRTFERTISACSWERPDEETLVFSIEANAFLRNMNRILVGTMLEVASDRRGLEDFTRLLEGRPRSEAGVTARPHGLYLDAVRY